VVYVTAIFPYIVLTIFFFRGITLKGALAGLQHMFSPKVGHRSRKGWGVNIVYIYLVYYNFYSLDIS
jgi:SNF family Na+-dependent transporter